MEAVKLEEIKENKLLGRKEVHLRIDHLGKGTPTRKEVREKVAEMLKTNIENIYVISIRTEYGSFVSWAKVHVYDDPQRALQIEPKYIIERNTKEENERE